MARLLALTSAMEAANGMPLLATPAPLVSLAVGASLDAPVVIGLASSHGRFQP